MSRERETTAARLWLDDEGIIRYVSIGTESTAATVAEGFAAIREVAGGKRVPILFDSRAWPKGDPGSWSRFIASLESVCVAAAVITNPRSEKAMGAFPQLVDNLLIPFRLFADEEQALDFLRSHLND